jgi:hypothetical protein
MARRIVRELVDDLDGTPAAETVRFGLDGVLYDIDLSIAHAARLRRSSPVSFGRGGGAVKGRRYRS